MGRVCGPSSAIGLLAWERERWAVVKEQLRQSGQYPGLMRGFLADKEVAAVISTTREGMAVPLAVIVSHEIEEELDLPGGGTGWVAARIGDYPAEAYVERTSEGLRPVAVRMTPWLNEYLVLYARKLWTSRR